MNDLNKETVNFVKKGTASLYDKIFLVDLMEAKMRQPNNESFKVRPLSIDQTLFKEERKDPKEEKVRQWIQQAFEVMKNNMKYAKSFNVSPGKKARKVSIKILDLVFEFEGVGNEVYKALELAQRINDGESWKKICNTDTQTWYRIKRLRSNYKNMKIDGNSTINVPYIIIS